MYTITHILKSFNPLTAKLTVEVSILWDGVFVESNNISVTLPVDAQGQATTDLRLINSLVQNRIRRYYSDVVDNTRLPPAGVVNAQAIYQLTQDIEAG